MRLSETNAGYRSLVQRCVLLVGLAARAVLLVALALFLKGEGVQAAEHTPTPERRVALVIGNSNYINFRPSLPNPRNDAEDVSAALKEAGFNVFLGIDLTKSGMEKLISSFAEAAVGADAAVTYYAGHGMQYQGRNYLIPIDAKIEKETDINRDTIKANDLVDSVSLAKGVRIIILDACRNLPLNVRNNIESSWTRISGRDLVVAYATQANDLAYDGVDRNSLFTAAFLEAMKIPGLDLPQFFQKVSATVDFNSMRRQTMELSNSFPGKFLFNRSETAPEAWGRVYNSNDPEAYREFIRKYPKDYLADAARGRLIVIEEAIRLQQEANAERKRKELQKEADAERKRKELQAELILPPEITAPLQDRDLGTSRTTTQDKAPSDPILPKSPFPQDVLKRDKLHYQTEAELGRIGCLREGADTEWNDTSIAALNRYARQAKSLSIPNEPTQELLDILKREKAAFCPIECGSGQRPSGDSCIAVTRPEQQPKSLKPAEQKAAARKSPKHDEAPETKQAVRSKTKLLPNQAREKTETRQQAARPTLRPQVDVERPQRSSPPPSHPVTNSRPPATTVPQRVTTITAGSPPPRPNTNRGPWMGGNF